MNRGCRFPLVSPFSTAHGLLTPVGIVIASRTVSATAETSRHGADLHLIWYARASTPPYIAVNEDEQR